MLFTDIHLSNRMARNVKYKWYDSNQWTSAYNSNLFSKDYKQYCNATEIYNVLVESTSDPLSEISINITGSIRCALYVLNNVINITRESLLRQTFRFVNLNTGNKVREKAIGSPAWSDKEYFPILARYPQITTILLAWQSLRVNDMDTCDLPVKWYYSSPWPLHSVCSSNTMQETECSRHMNASNIFKKMKTSPDGFFSFSNAKYSTRPIPGQPDQIFLHIVHNSYLDYHGNVATEDLDIVPFQCQARGTNRNSIESTPHYEEVFTVAQMWGEGFYHKSIEDMPRIAPFLDFLLENTHIKIHVKNGSMPHMELLGIGKQEHFYIWSLGIGHLLLGMGEGLGRMKSAQIFINILGYWELPWKLF